MQLWSHGALHHTALHRTALHCTALHCTALHCTMLTTQPGPRGVIFAKGYNSNSIALIRIFYLVEFSCVFGRSLGNFTQVKVIKNRLFSANADGTVVNALLRV